MITDTHLLYTKSFAEIYNEHSDLYLDKKGESSEIQSTLKWPGIINNGVVYDSICQGDSTGMLARIAESSPYIKGVTDYTNLESDLLPEVLDVYRKCAVIKGFGSGNRILKAGEFLNPSFIRGVKVLKVYGYHFELLVDAALPAEIIDFADSLPGVKIVVTPYLNLSEQARRLNEEVYRELSLFENTWIKFTGLSPKHNEKLDNNRGIRGDFFRLLYDAFTPKRILFGSGQVLFGSGFSNDEPVNSLISIAREHSQEDIVSVLNNNASEFYGF